MINNKVHIFVSAAGKANQNGTGVVFSCIFHCISNCMRTFNRRNDSFKTAKFIESFHCFLIADLNVIYTADITQESMFRTDGRIIESTCDRINRTGISVVILKKIAVESMENTGFAVCHRSSMVTYCRTSSERFNTCSNINAPLRSASRIALAADSLASQ